MTLTAMQKYFQKSVYDTCFISYKLLLIRKSANRQYQIRFNLDLKKSH